MEEDLEEIKKNLQHSKTKNFKNRLSEIRKK